jgi:hypothetical protein
VSAIDAYTLRHLDAWLDRQVDGDACRAEVRGAMLELVETDPEYWGAQSWWNVFDRARCQQIRERHGRSAP